MMSSKCDALQKLATLNLVETEEKLIHKLPNAGKRIMKENVSKSNIVFPLP